MRWTWRPAGADSGLSAADVGLAIVAAGLTALVAWGPPGRIGTVMAGPAWLKAVLPVLIGAPLAWRRRAPLLMWAALWAAVTLQALVSLKATAGLELMFPLFVGGYSVGAHSRPRRALAGLAIMLPGAVAYLLTSHGIENPHPYLFLAHSAVLTGQSLTASFFFAAQILVCWLLGVLVRARREAAALAGRNATLERRAEQAAAAERARIARELHDIVAHHLSVVVLQAAGARASGKPADAALQKIERSGRAALAEMRRLLSVLREPPEEEPGRYPQPGVDELPALAESVRAAGLTVDLVVDGDHRPLPAAVDVSAYRIVQEALTNVLKHAGPAHAEVAVGCADGAVMIEVTDDGPGVATAGEAGGHGLAGMRERVAIFGGELRAGPRPGGGYSVRARLPLGDEPCPASP